MIIYSSVCKGRITENELFAKAASPHEVAPYPKYDRDEEEEPEGPGAEDDAGAEEP